MEPRELGFPYEEEVQELIQDLSVFETRVRPRESEENTRLELDYGWQALLYDSSESLFEKSLKKVQEPFATGSYRMAPDHEWELKAPNGEVYRRMGIDLSPEEFEKKVYRFRE